MAAKRARRSTSIGETDLLLWLPVESMDGRIERREPPLPPPSVPVRISESKKRSVVPKKTVSPPSLFSLSSPVAEDVIGVAPVAVVLDRCHNCSEKIPGDKSIFMYSSNGFCSVECRQEQIENDNKMEKLTSKSQRTRKICGLNKKM